MREITEAEHSLLMIDSSKKLLKAYKLTGGIVVSNLKLVSIIYRLLYNTCGIATTRERHKLSQLYYKMTREDRLICMPNTSGSAFKSNNFKQFHLNKEVIPTILYAKYFQAEPSEVVGDIKGRISVDDIPIDAIEVKADLLKIGFDFNLSKAGRLVILLPNQITVSTIEDTLTNDITQAFDFSIINNNFVIISKNLLSSGKIYLKLT